MNNITPKHATTLDDFISVEDAGKHIANSNLDECYYFFCYLSYELKEESKKDRANNKPNLSKSLEYASNALNLQQNKIIRHMRSIPEPENKEYLKNLAKRSKNLRYDSLLNLLNTSNNYLIIQGITKPDKIVEYQTIQECLHCATEYIFQAWKHSKPHMNEFDSNSIYTS